MRVALVHDWLNQYGGAERVLELFHRMYPQAPVFTSIFAPAAFPRAYRQWDIRTSFMQRLPLVKRKHQPFMPIYPFAFESFDFSEFDLVISNASAFCHGIMTTPATRHICYCLTPTRFIWNYPEYSRQEALGRPARLLLPLFLAPLRVWDRVSADRVDDFVAISEAVADRVNKYYRRPATVIHPPVDCATYQLSDEVDDFYLIVSRLVPYKRVDLAIKAFNKLGVPLLIAGDGRDRARLERLAAANVRFLGRVSEQELRRLYSRCRAFIFPGEEDFGLTPVEAQASGRPVIAYAAGGALDTVLPGQTGAFFSQRSPDALAEVVSSFQAESYDPRAIRAQAERFDVSRFEEKFRSFVAGAMANDDGGLAEGAAR